MEGDLSALADRAKRNGHGKGDGDAGGLRGRLSPATAIARAGGGAASRTGQRIAGAVLGPATRRIGRALTADLDDRDPDFIRENLPLAWLLSTLWYRAEVRNLGNVPEEGPVLLVGNHTGGNMSPEVMVLPLAFSTFFGVERPFYQLAHNLVLASPFGPVLRRFGAMAASQEHARRALHCGAAVLVFPGGDWEVHRPTWERNQVDFGGRKGFIRLALEENVPVVPVVTVGGQETALFLSRGAWLARALRLDRTLRLKVLPISLALPWIVNVGDLAGHLPLPAKITIEVLPAIELREQFGPDPDPDEIYDHMMRVMQETLHSLAAERRFPGDRLMRLNESIVVSAPAKQIWDYIAEPANYLHFMHGVTRWEVAGDRATGLGARYRMLIRVGSTEVGGLIEVVEFNEPRDMAWSSVTGIDQRGRWRLRALEDGRTQVQLRFAYGVAGAGIPGWISELVAAPTLGSHIRRSLQQLKRQVEHERLRAEAARRRLEREHAA